MAGADLQKVIAFLQAKWGSAPCPMCHVASWNVMEESFELRGFHGGNLVIGSGPIVPLLVITCNNCGNTVLVNAIAAGVVDKAAPAVPARPEPADNAAVAEAKKS